MTLKEKVEKLMSEILTDKYGEEYGVKITVHFEPKDPDKAEKSKRGTSSPYTTKTASTQISAM